MNPNPDESKPPASAGATALRLVGGVIGFVVAYVVMYYITSGGKLPFVGQ